MTWEIEIFGEDYVLRELSHSLQTKKYNIEERENRFFLCGPIFSEFQDDKEVRECGEKIVKSLSGMARILLGSDQEITTGALIKINEDGRRHIFMTIGPAVCHVKAMPLAAVKISKEGKIIEERRPADPAPAILEIVFENEVVERALRLRDEGKNLDWVSLYRLFEVIESDIPIKGMPENGWASRNRIALFKRTACSIEAVGDQARHGKSVGDPPKNPMKLSEAREFVDDILKKWLTWKGA